MRTFRIVFTVANLGLWALTVPAAAQELSPVAVPPSGLSLSAAASDAGTLVWHVNAGNTASQTQHGGYAEDGAAIAGAGAR